MSSAEPVPDLAADLALALRLADAADAISLPRHRALDITVETKPDRTPVTDADRAVEASIRSAVARERPEDGFYGEETGTTEGTGDGARRQWIVDPIDGTANFLRGVPIWGTLIALAIDGVPVVGVASCPALGRRWWAARGEGAWTFDRLRDAEGEQRRLRVSGVSTLADAGVVFPRLEGWVEEGLLEPAVELATRAWRTIGGSDLWSYCLVAEGVSDAIAEFGVQPYDIAAVIPIVEEAGGRFTSASGEPGPWSGSAVASNGLVHEELLAIIAGRG